MTLDIGNVFGEGALHIRVKVGIFFNKFGRKSFEQPEHVVCDQHLPITPKTCANANGWDGEFFRNQPCQARRHGFKN